MTFLKDLLNLFVKDGLKNIQTEDELMKTINKRIDYSSVNENAYDDTKSKTTSVPAVGSWAEFSYVGLPPVKGIASLKTDNRIYFTIPCGWELDPEPKFWYLCFPLNGTHEEVIEFFTTYDVLKSAVRG